VLLAPGRFQVYPRSGQADLRVEAGQPRDYGPLLPPGDVTTVLLVVTETPAADLLRQALPAEGAKPDQVDAVLADLQTALWQAGHRWAAVDRFTIGPVVSP
jgi:hypothetical protein